MVKEYPNDHNDDTTRESTEEHTSFDTTDDGTVRHDSGTRPGDSRKPPETTPNLPVNTRPAGTDARSVESIPRQVRVEAGLLSTSWLGTLPPPEIFERYAPDVRERMMRWNDSRTIDEAECLKILTHSKVKNSRAAMRYSALFTGAFLACAAVAGFVFRDTGLAALFLGVPVLSIVVTFIRSALH